jgi:predicted aminopeptidase
MQPSIFVSYAHEDASLAQTLATALESQGARVWIDQGETRPPPGSYDHPILDRLDPPALVAACNQSRPDRDRSRSAIDSRKPLRMFSILSAT